MAEDGQGAPHSSVWLRQRSTRAEGRGRQAPAGLSRDRIVRAAMRLLDADGLKGFSMRRLAADLGVTPMSVYWYVDNKDDLLELALDEVFGDVGLPQAPPVAPAADPDHAGGETDWRVQLRALAREWRGALIRHPWATRLFGTYLNLGPRALAVSRAAVGIISHSGLPPEQHSAALGLVFNYVYGFVAIEAHWHDNARRTGMTDEELYETGYALAKQLDPELMAHVDRVHPDRGRGLAALRERDFELALDCAVIGIESMAAAARYAASAPEQAPRPEEARTAPR